MSSDFERDLTAKIAWLYYKESLTQQEISELLNIPRQKIIKYLDVARNTNVVQFQFAEESQMYMDIRQQLIDRFKLQDAYIVPSEGNSPMRTVSLAAAQYIMHRLDHTNHLAINVGAGRTIMKTLSYITVPFGKELSLISLTGGVSYYVHAQGSFNIARSPLNQVKSYIIPAPHRASSVESAKCFLSEPSVKNIMEMGKFADITLLGIGVATNEATMVREGLMSESEIAIIQMNHAVGDMLSQYYDIDGNKVDFSGQDRFITTDLRTLHSFKNVIGIAGGEDRVLPIIGALRGNYLDILITDYATAKAVLDFSS